MDGELAQMRANQILLALKLSKYKITPTTIEEWNTIKRIKVEIDGSLMQTAARIFKTYRYDTAGDYAERQFLYDEDVRSIIYMIKNAHISTDAKTALLVYLQDPGRCEKVPNVSELMIMDLCRLQIEAFTLAWQTKTHERCEWGVTLRDMLGEF